MKTFSKKSIELAFVFPGGKINQKQYKNKKLTWTGGVLARWLIRRLQGSYARDSVGAATGRTWCRLSFVADAVVASKHWIFAFPGPEFSVAQARGVAVRPLPPLMPLTVDPFIEKEIESMNTEENEKHKFHM